MEQVAILNLVVKIDLPWSVTFKTGGRQIREPSGYLREEQSGRGKIAQGPYVKSGWYVQGATRR